MSLAIARIEPLSIAAEKSDDERIVQLFGVDHFAAVALVEHPDEGYRGPVLEAEMRAAMET